MICGGTDFQAFNYWEMKSNVVLGIYYSCNRCGMIYEKKPDKCTFRSVLYKLWTGDPINDMTDGIYQETWYGFARYIEGRKIEGMIWGEAKKIEGVVVE